MRGPGGKQLPPQCQRQTRASILESASRHRTVEQPQACSISRCSNCVHVDRAWETSPRMSLHTMHFEHVSSPAAPSSLHIADWAKAEAGTEITRASRSRFIAIRYGSRWQVWQRWIRDWPEGPSWRGVQVCLCLGKEPIIFVTNDLCQHPPSVRRVAY